MKIKMRFMIMILVVTVTTSCSDQYDYLAQLNTAPQIYIKKDTLTKYLYDSVKLNSSNYYNTVLKMTDVDKNINSLTYENYVGSCKVLYNNDTTNTNSLPISQTNSELTIAIKPKTTGIHNIRFELKDRFDEISQAELKLFCFVNIKPKAILDINKIAQNDPLEYEISGANSYDQDERFGGAITKYYFIIQGNTTISYSPKIRYIFPLQGVYKVDLITEDNEGTRSDMVTKFYNVN